MNQSMHSNLVLQPRQTRIIRLAIVQKKFGWMQCRWIYYIAFEGYYTPSAMQIMFVIHDLFSIPVVFHFIRLHRYKVDCCIFSLNGEEICFVCDRKYQNLMQLLTVCDFLHAQEWLRKIRIFHLTNSPVRSVSNSKVQPSIWLWITHFKRLNY